MWWLLSKKEFRKKLRKTGQYLHALIKTNSDNIQQLQTKVSKLEGALSILVSQSQKSQRSLKQVSDKRETYVVSQFRKSKRSSIQNRIKELSSSMNIPEIKVIIVDRDRLCSKASFYRYVSSLKSHKVIETETRKT